jgi:hypothetical protein
MFEDTPADDRVVRVLTERMSLDVSDDPLVDVLVLGQSVGGRVETHEPDCSWEIERQREAAPRVEHVPKRLLLEYAVDEPLNLAQRLVLVDQGTRVRGHAPQPTLSTETRVAKASGDCRHAPSGKT